MQTLQLHRTLLAYEQDCNEKMLAMIESVPDDRRSDARFSQALTLAAHLAACRENWLNWMQENGVRPGPWFERDVELATLRPRFAAIEALWIAYLDSLTDETVDRVFTFVEGNGESFRWSTEGQIVQLSGHALYHRGQIALLVDQLGGTTVDTDYVDWAWARDPRFNVSAAE